MYQHSYLALAAPISRKGELILLGDDPDGVEVRVDPDRVAKVEYFLMLLDGSRSVRSVAEMAGIEPDTAERLLGVLDREHLLANAVPAPAIAGVTALLELEDLTCELLYNTLYRNPYWQAMQNLDQPVPEQVLYGTIVENYHFLFRESWFDAPVLSYPYSRGARVSLIEFFAEESGHDELILRSLIRLGYSRDDLADTIPLQTTAALCNSLAWWSRTDPLFFVTTIGVLEGRDLAVDSFVLSCERRGVDPGIVGPMRRHSEINLEGGHGSLTRQVFAEIPAIDAATMTRLRGQTHLFVELYDGFYRGIWEYYSTAPELLRRISSLTGERP
jgi:hypothetical protein